MVNLAKTFLSSLQPLRAVELREISSRCGVSISGTKSLLCDRIVSSLETVPPILPKSLLSIDMGVRNFAMCLLVPTTKGISVKKWQRIEIVEKDAPSTIFEPLQLSGLAYQICKKLVSMRPEYVLIERQRHRSGGASAILEWTLRVNTFEAMIHAILHTLVQESKWSGSIESVHPKRVSDYWIRNRAEKLTSRELKVQKIGIVSEMVNKRSSKIHFEGCAQETVQVFVGRPKGKVDDIADSFLQGITWIRWQQAKLRVKARLLQKGDQISAKELSALLQ